MNKLRVVIADTGPVHYLVLIGHIDILPELFGSVTIPSAVQCELVHAEAPETVRTWIASPPGWLNVLGVPSGTGQEMAVEQLDDGERAVITLASSINADLLLIRSSFAQDPEPLYFHGDCAVDGTIV